MRAGSNPKALSQSCTPPSSHAPCGPEDGQEKGGRGGGRGAPRDACGCAGRSSSRPENRLSLMHCRPPVRLDLRRAPAGE